MVLEGMSSMPNEPAKRKAGAAALLREAAARQAACDWDEAFCGDAEAVFAIGDKRA